MFEVDFFDTVLVVAEYSPVLFAMSIISVGLVRKELRCLAAMALPLALSAMIGRS